MSIIYKITNTLNRKVYIGQTVRSLKKRWSCHCACKSEDHFHRAIQKYGKEIWLVEIQEEIDDISLLNEREIYWIKFFDSFNNGYNLTSGGEQNKEVSIITRERLRKANSGKTLPPEQKEKMRQAALLIKHKPHSEETKAKMRLAHKGHKGKPCTEEAKEHLRKVHKGKHYSPASEFRPNCVPWNKKI